MLGQVHRFPMDAFDRTRFDGLITVCLGEAFGRDDKGLFILLVKTKHIPSSGHNSTLP